MVDGQCAMPYASDAAGLAATAITNALRTDGFGAQYAALASVYSWARLVRRPFCVTPWKQHEHQTNSTSLAMFSFVGGPLYGPCCSTNTTPAASERHMELSTWAYQHRSRQGNSTWWRNTLWHPDVLHFYRRSAKPPLHWFEKARAGSRVAVHVRRGDVAAQMSRDRLMRSRYLSNGLVATCVMGAMRLARIPYGTPIHVFSEGHEADFGPLRAVAHVQFHLNTPLLEVRIHSGLTTPVNVDTCNIWTATHARRCVPPSRSYRRRFITWLMLTC